MDFSTRQLRQQILSLAIQGKLVPQIAAEGNAQDLLQKIEAERKKSNPKCKPLSPVTDEEKPFEIPENWEWVRLGEIVNSLSDGVHYAPHYIDSGIPCFSAKDIFEDKVHYDKCYYISETEYESMIEKINIQDGSILVTKSGSIGRTTLITKFFKFGLVESVGVINLSKYLCPLYIKRVIDQIFNLGFDNEYTNGIGVKHLTLKLLSTIKVPLPPLSEQKRIVEKLEVLLGELDTIEQTKEQIEHYAEQLQGQILQTAIQGKLVPQIASEGNAQDLLQKIEAERKKTNPKYKPLPPVSDEEKPFEIPESWVWVRLGELAFYKKGPFGSELTKSMFVPKAKDTYKVYEQQHAIKKTIDLGSYYISKEKFESMKGFEVKGGDIIVSCAGTIGETYKIPINAPMGIINQALMLIRLYEVDIEKYYLIYFDSILKKQANEDGKGSAMKNIPPFAELKKYLIPLPPLSEQKRIVAKLEELLGEVEKLKR